MQFILPQKITFDTAPIPKNPRVLVKEVKPRVIAALVFNGAADTKLIEEKSAALKTALEAAGKKAKGPIIQAFYNSPYTFARYRRNEVWVELDL